MPLWAKIIMPIAALLVIAGIYNAANKDPATRSERRPTTIASGSAQARTTESPSSLQGTTSAPSTSTSATTISDPNAIAASETTTSIGATKHGTPTPCCAPPTTSKARVRGKVVTGGSFCSKLGAIAKTANGRVMICADRNRAGIIHAGGRPRWRAP